MKDLVKSVLKVFDGKQKRKLVGMMFLILINSGVSLLGVSVLSPFITAVMNPEELLKNDIIRSVYDGFHMQNTNQLITLLSVLIIIVYIAKNAFIIFINNMLYCFSYYGKREMQDRMMKYYISRDYTFFLNHNSADFHAHLGYKTVGTFKKCGYKFGRWYDMVWMEKIRSRNTVWSRSSSSVKRVSGNTKECGRISPQQLVSGLIWSIHM